MHQFGEILRQKRSARAWRQRDLVEALGGEFARSTIANVEAGREPPTERLWLAIGTWLPDWVDELAPAYAVSRSAPRRRTRTGTANGATRSAAGTVDLESHPVGGPFRIESLQFVYTFRHSHSPEEIIEIRRVRALQSGADAYGLRFTATSTDDFSVEEEALWGGSLSASLYRTVENRVHYVRRFEFGRSLRRGQTHDFAVRSWVERDPNPSTEVLFSVTLPTDLAVIHLNFAGPEKPRAVWSYGPLFTDDLTPKTQQSAGTTLPMSELGNVTLRVDKPNSGAHYGIGWSW
ncbi:MAG: helix-turn-helix transcriptional regulator [Nocardioidaceae bacterium]|nr:helix-turn-helix transcriptional regulator [Nocardioidaceae bacterium]